MKLFRYEGFKVVISEEALALKPFKKLWDRDKTQSKERAIMELGYIYFFLDPRSDYQYLTDPEDRDNAIREGEGIPEKWKIDKVMQEAMDFYASFKTPSALLLEDTRVAVEKLRKLLRDIDLSETDDKGRPVYTLNTITATIKQIPDLVKGLNEAEKAINDEIKEQGKMRGQGEKTLFEDGF